MPDTDLALINASVSSLDPADFPRIVEVLDKIAQAKRWLAELQREAEAVGVVSLQQHGAQVIGDVRWYAAFDKDTKCTSPQRALDLVMTASQGDSDRFVACLSANAFKPGACRQLFEEAGIPGAFDECFAVEEKPKMREGKPTKSLKAVPLAMLE